METKVSYKGSKAFSLLGIVFIVLKLVGVIDWSWWWVLLPFWGSICSFYYCSYYNRINCIYKR